MKVPIIVGDARDPQVLRQARVGAARAVIASIDGDMADIEIALVAREINPHVRVILRAFSEELNADLEQTFGPGSAFSTSGLAATTFSAALISRGLEYVIPYGPGSQMLGIAELQLGKGSPLIGKIGVLEAAFATRLLAVRGASGRMVNRTDVRAGDTITLIGSLDGLASARAVSGSPNAPSSASGALSPFGPDSTVVICGLGKVGFRVVRRLHALERPPRLVVIDLLGDHQHFVKRVQEMDGVTYIQGDATDGDLLKEAGIERATAVAALSSKDDVNLRIGLAARSAHPGVHVVLRVFSHTLAGELVQLFGIHTTYSTSNLASPTLAMAGLLRGIRRAFYTGDTPYVSFDWEITAGDRFARLTGEQVRARYGVIVAARWRAGAVTPLPQLTEPLVVGDKISVVGLAGDVVRAKLLATS
jgi:Trk K+ transport system NAD-binding subunit